MSRLAAFALIGSLALLGAALAENKSSPSAPKEKELRGEFTPERIKNDQEANAKKQEGKVRQRGRIYRALWGTLSPAEFEALGRHTLMLIAVWTHKPEELPVKRVFLRADGGETTLCKVSTWKMPVDAGSLTANIYGANREDGFYLVPGGALLRKGQISMDLSSGPTNWILWELPSVVSTKDATRFPNPDPAPGAKPDLKALQQVIERRFTGFPLPQALSC
jgi:hypothetical protein